MFQVQSHKAAHHQNQQIEHYIFENTLLAQRNSLLTQENKRLLDQLQQSHRQLQDNELLKAQRVLQQHKFALRTTVQELQLIGKQLGSTNNSPIGLFLKQLEQASQQKVQIQNIHKGLVSIIRKLAESYQDLKLQRVKSKISSKQQRLLSRRNAIENTQRVLHIIKEPDQIIRSNNHKVILQELKHQRQLFEKLLRKVRREDISFRRIQEVLGLMERSSKMRLNLRRQQSQLMLLQRQFELGWIEPSSLTNTIAKIQYLGRQLGKIKISIEEEIQVI